MLKLVTWYAFKSAVRVSVIIPFYLKVRLVLLYIYIYICYIKNNHLVPDTAVIEEITGQKLEDSSIFQ